MSCSFALTFSKGSENKFITIYVISYTILNNPRPNRWIISACHSINVDNTFDKSLNVARNRLLENKRAISESIVEVKGLDSSTFLKI